MQTHIVFGPLHPLCVFLILLINGSQSLSSSVPSVLVTTTLHRVTICIYFFLFLFTSLSDFIGLPAWMCAFLPVSHFLSCVLWYVCTDVSPLPASLSAGGLYLIQMNCVVFQKS